MGGGGNFLNFIERELIPYIDKNYKNRTNKKLWLGHSLGGLLALNSFMDKKSIFNAYLSIDPSIWWDEKMMETKVDSLSSISLNKKLFIATANQGEANYGRNINKDTTIFLN